MSANPEVESQDSQGEVILVAAGADRPGLLDEISHYVADRAAEIRQSRVSILRGRFALLLLVAGDAGARRRVADDLDILRDRAGVRAFVEPVAGDGDAPRRMSLRAGDAAADAANGSTSLRQLSNLLRVLNVNIQDVQSGPGEAGGFEMSLLLGVPRGVPEAKFRELLGQLFAARKLQWRLAEAEEDSHE